MNFLMFIQDYKRLQFVNPDRYPRRFAIIALTSTTQTFQRPRRMDHSLELDANSSRSGVCSRSPLMTRPPSSLWTFLAWPTCRLKFIDRADELMMGWDGCARPTLGSFKRSTLNGGTHPSTSATIGTLDDQRTVPKTITDGVERRAQQPLETEGLRVSHVVDVFSSPIPLFSSKTHFDNPKPNQLMNKPPSAAPTSPSIHLYL